MSVFGQAKKSITRGLIEVMFPGGDWRGSEYWVRSPLRNDGNAGSFHISESGAFYDHATQEGGTFIDLVAAASGRKPQEAATEIVKRAGGVPESKPQRQAKAPKVTPVIPIPDTEAASLNQEIRGACAQETHGKAVKGWRYHTLDGGWAFAVVRFQNCPSGRKKEVVPYYWGSDSRWHEGQAYADGRPLYRLASLASAERVLIVEGEKCADCTVPGYELATSSAGAAAAGKTDWSPLADLAAAGRVLIWPDADRQQDKPWEKQPGMRYALAIANRLPGAKILDTRRLAERKDGYDIADAVAEGLDPLKVIEECGVYAAPETAEGDPDAETAQFFRCLGYDSDRYWFLREGKRMPQSIGLGSWTGSKLQELAPLAWWGSMGMLGDNGAIKVAIAQDYVTGIQERIGRYNPDILRGAGVWRDEERIIANDGRRIITQDGKAIAYADFPTRSRYLSSDVVFGDLSGRAATEAEGIGLADLFERQGWQSSAHTVAALGWSLIAPFGGLLSWRPHIWVTGRKGTGKSWVFENLISRLLGEFAYRGSGKDSEAGIRRSLRTDARPVLLDEMEPLDKRSAERVTNILTLARNASSDASGYMTIAGPDGGTIQYRVRSCFCFASVQTPTIGAAIDSRIIKCELKWMTREQMASKKQRTAELLASVMRDPGIFRRRIFRSLGRILGDIDALRNGLLDALGDQRAADQWAPIIAAVYSLISTDSIDTTEGRRWLADYIPVIAETGDEMVEDEDRVIGHVLSAQIDTDGKTRRTVAELLKIADDFAHSAQADTASLLARYGIRIIPRKDGGYSLAIETRSDELLRILRGTPYEAGYDAQLKRHALCINPDATTSTRMGERKVKARYLDWERFKEEYMGGALDG